MKTQKRILSIERLRRVPEGFGFIDHRLVRDGHLRRADAKAWALYLVLVTVGDEHGLSYYGEASLGRLLSLSTAEVAAARRHPKAGPRLANLFTVVENCRLAGVDPEAYLVDLIARLPDHPMKRIAELLPHAWKTARVAMPAVIAPPAAVV